MQQKLDVKVLDKIVKQTIAAIEKSKAQIFDIYEAARAEMENLKKDVERVKQEITDIIFKVDELEKKERRARLRLMEVSRNFHVYTEQDIRAAYEEASNIQVELAVAREQEHNMRRQRDELDLRLKALKNTVDKAEGLVSQVGAALGLLGDQMGGVLATMETLQQRQAFGVKIIRAQEEERRRVARDIHDGPAQALANVVFRAEVCERLIDTDIERAKQELKDLREQVRLVLKETRQIIFGLRPMTLDDLGLVPTVKRLLDGVKERTNMLTEVRVLGTETRLESHIEVGAFRIIQEAINNAEKHSGARMLRVIIEFGSGHITAVIEDDGRGFDASGDFGAESFGLMGMQERVRNLGGDIVVKTHKGKGTKLVVKIPLSKV